MAYQVTIDFKSGPSFGPWLVRADDESIARLKAENDAKACGWTAAIKKITVRVASAAQ